MGKPGEEEQKLGDPAFLRRVASDLRHNRDLRNAMALERIADRLERAAQTPPQNTGHD